MIMSGAIFKLAYNVKVLGAVERQPVRWENCAKHVLCVCVAVI